MRWEDERYVRFYTRDTPEWLALTWQARGLFGLLIRAVDRAGLLKVGKLGLKGAAVAVRAAWVEVEQPLKELLEDGCVVLRGDTLVIGNFLAAQEARQSDAARKRKEREVDLAKANAEKVTARDALRSQDVTEQGHEIGLDVTDGHTESQDVTPRHAVPSLAVPSLAVPSSAHDAQPSDAARNSEAQGQPADVDPWPADLVERIRGPLKRQLPACDNEFADWLRGFSVWPLKRRENAALVLLERARGGKTFQLAYLGKLITEGAEPQATAPPRYTNGERQYTADEAEAFRRRHQPPAIPDKHETADERKNRLLARAEADLAAQKRGAS